MIIDAKIGLSIYYMLFNQLSHNIKKHNNIIFIMRFFKKHNIKYKKLQDDCKNIQIHFKIIGSNRMITLTMINVTGTI